MHVCIPKYDFKGDLFHMQLIFCFYFLWCEINTCIFTYMLYMYVYMYISIYCFVVASDCLRLASPDLPGCQPAWLPQFIATNFPRSLFELHKLFTLIFSIW